MTKILIINSYTWLEKGDAAVLISMLYALRQQFPQAEFTALTNTPDVDRKQFMNYDDRLRVLKNLLVAPNKYSRPAKAFTYLWEAAKDISMVVLRTPKTFYNETLKAYVDADVILSCGGGYLGGHHIGMLIHLYRIYMGKLLKKPVVLFCVSIEPCGNIIKKATRFVLNRVDLIIVREKLSQAYLQGLGIKTPISLGADAAFLLPDHLSPAVNGWLAKEGVHKKADELLVGVSVRDWHFLQYRGKLRRKKASNYFSAMVEAIKYLISDHGARIVFFTMVTYPATEDDRTITRNIAEAVGGDRVTVLTGDYRPEDLMQIFGNLDLIISSRLHATLLAASLGVPAIGIAGEHNKFKGIMEMLGAGEYVLLIDDMMASDLITKIDGLLGARDKVRKTLLINSARMKSLVESSAQLICREIE
jgi:colanic acid/amylovoran biosynthesis protein